MALARFEPIGPFDLGRCDQVIAASYLGFVASKGIGKIWSYGIVLLSVMLIVSGILFGDAWDIASGVGISLLFLVLPALRSNRRNRGIVVSYDEEGLQIETGQVRTIYRWECIGPSRIFANRLFVMIDRNCGLVIPGRATSSDNFAHLASCCRGGTAG